MHNDSEQPEFDQYAADYDKLLRDPIRDRFSGGSEFFFQRKWELLQEYFASRGVQTSSSRWLDVGCGRGELLRLGAARFEEVCGCDISIKMMRSVSGIRVVAQTEKTKLPFASGTFDLVTAVCVYHHVEPMDRPALTSEIARLLKPSGTACIIEHNPFNPMTQLIVLRTPVDVDARLLRAATAHRLLADQGLRPTATRYFLYFPKSVYSRVKSLEAGLAAFPLGGQYAVFAQKGDPPA
jgi:SAM-dependent methyltransferase